MPQESSNSFGVAETLYQLLMIVSGSQIVPLFPVSSERHFWNNYIQDFQIVELHWTYPEWQWYRVDIDFAGSLVLLLLWMLIPNDQKCFPCNRQTLIQRLQLSNDFLVNTTYLRHWFQTMGYSSHRCWSVTSAFHYKCPGTTLPSKIQRSSWTSCGHVQTCST